MMNIEQITTRLAKLPDQALQQYAAMHKNDPYIIALAVSESNRRKQMRQAAQGAQGEMEQPTVVDQDIAEMAPAPVAPQQMMPEDTGIAQLPMGEMEFAGGGIVAFADGGDVERYQYGGMPPASAGTEFAIPGMAQPSRSFMPQAGAPEQEPFLRRMYRDAELQAARRRAAEAQARIDRGLNYESDREAVLALQSLERQAVAPNPATSVGVQGAAAENLSGMDRRLMANPQTFAAVAPSATPTTPAAPGAGSGADTTVATRGAGPGASTTPATTAAMPGNIGDINAMLKKALEAQKYEDPAKGDVEKLGRALTGGAERRLREFDAEVAKQGDVFKNRDTRIAAREAELGKQKETNTGLSLLNAGLAIMSTPGGLATAIGKGARVGTEQFAAGLDKIRAAQERLEEAKDKVEELRLNRADMTAKERRALTADIDKAQADVLRMSIDGTRMAAGVTEKRAAEIVGNQVKVGIAQLEQTGQNARTAATIAAGKTSPEMRMAMALGTGNTDAERLESGMRKLQDIQSDKTGMTVVKTLVETNAKREAQGQPPITMQEMLTQLREYQALINPRVGDTQPTRARP